MHKHMPRLNMRAPTYPPTQSAAQALKDQLMTHRCMHRPLPAGGGMASDRSQVVLTHKDGVQACTIHKNTHREKQRGSYMNTLVDTQGSCTHGNTL